MTIKKTSVSIILPVYNEEHSIPMFFKELEKTLLPMRLDMDFDIIYIDDGSSDNTLPLLKNLQKDSDNISIISFSRNFGKESAMKAGLDYCVGDCAIIMDSDFEDPVHLIPKMISKWQEGHDIVYTVRAKRKEHFLKRLTAYLFYKVINMISETEIYDNVGDYRLLDRKVVEAMKQFSEVNRFSKGLFNWVGFESTCLSFDRIERPYGKTKWNYRSLWKYSLDGIVSFSSVPLKISSYLGVICALLALSYGIFIIVRTIKYGIDVPGYASLLTIILFFNGLLFINLGILGEYISRIFLETKHRPHYFVNEYIKK